jgi:hypothetical protein
MSRNGLRPKGRSEVMKLNSIIFGSRFGILCCLLSATLSSVAAAQKCTVTGDWTLKQENGITVKLSLLQKGERVTGSASFQGMKQGHGHTEIGKVSGVFKSEGKHSTTLRIDIKWEYGETGVYKGYLQNRVARNKYTSAQMIKGEAYITEDATNRDRRTYWQIVEDISCNSR